jgi:hypothetical protein
MAKNKKELMLEALFGGDMSPDLSSHHVQEAGRDLQSFNEMTLNTDINAEQTKNKLRTQPRTELRTISEQTTNKLRTENTAVAETKNKLRTQPRTELRTISEQTTNKLRTNSSFSQLVGLQKKIIEIIYRFCRINGEKTTDKISLEFLSSNCKANAAVVQVTTRRLISKGVLSKFDSKEGRGGWTRYSLPDVVYKELFQLETENKLSTNAEQTENKLRTQPRTEPRTTGPYSSSNNLNILTTNTGESDISAEITLPNNLSRFGISKNNLQKLVDDNLCSLELVQKSIEALSFDVENGKTGNLAAILFGVLRSGKEYISQKYSETLQQELDQELKRIQETEDQQKRLSEIKLQEKFRTYVDQNPQFIESIKNKNNTFVTSQELLEKVAFEEFKTLESI